MADELPCVEKLAFSSEEAAEGAAVYAKHRYGTRLKAYHCSHCGLWHLATA